MSPPTPLSLTDTLKSVLMKSTLRLLLLLFLVLVGVSRSRPHPHSLSSGHRHGSVSGRANRGSLRGGRKGQDTVQVAGSRLPDCSHACGSCSPCRLVMVSFVCASLEEAETCPMAYKCMCNNKSYPIP